MRLRSFFLLVPAILVSALLQAQRFGGNPPSLKWMQIDTDTMRVIFPVGLERQAARIRDISHHLAKTTTQTVGDGVRKIDIVLQNQAVISNAYVGLAPWRSEFYLTPLQNSMELGSLPWIDKLAIHEYRHVQQYMNYRKGLSKFAWIIAGEEGQALANAASIPDWFFEGDAVFQETSVTRQGRGRLPEFHNGFLSLRQDDRKYGYMKLRNGSMRDYVPNHYQLGYLLVAHGHDRYGKDFWRKVTDDAARFKPLIYPFQGAFKRHAGTSFKSFVNDALDAAMPEKEKMTADARTGEWITATDKRNVMDYHMPHVISPDSLLVLKRAYDEIPAWYLITAKGESRVAVKDIGIDDYYSHSRGRIAYSVFKPDARWSWKEFGGIRILDMTTGKRHTIAGNTRYFSPCLSHDGGRVVAVHVDGEGRSALHVLDADDGTILHKIPNPQQLFHTHPVFNKDDTEIISPVRDSLGRMALTAFRCDDGRQRLLIPYSFRPIAFPRVRGDRVIFTATYDRKDQIWCWNEDSKTASILTGHYTGSYGADIDEHRQAIVYSRTTADGLRISREALPSDSQPFPLEKWGGIVNPAMPNDMLLQDQDGSLEKLVATGYVARPYRKGSGLFNFHSWRPWYEQPDWSFSVFGENILNTFRSELYYQYNQNEGYQKTGFNGAYAGWYPWVTGGVSYTFDRFLSVAATDGNSIRTFRWNEWNANAGLRLPLNLSGGRHFRYLTLSGSYNNQQVMYKQTASAKPADRHIQYLQGGVSWVMQTQQALQQIHPRFAHSVLLQSRVATAKTAANQFLASGSLYLPGISRNHSIVVNGAYQARDTLGQYFFTNNFALARGYPGVDFPRMWKYGVNYHFTIAYPDAGFANILYVLRVRANLFYDASYAKSLRLKTTRPLRSFGTELYFDTKWWNQQNISFGIRYSRLLDADQFQKHPNPNQWEIIIPLNLIPNQ